jgi:hypothetical protein
LCQYWYISGGTLPAHGWSRHVGCWYNLTADGAQAPRLDCHDKGRASVADSDLDTGPIDFTQAGDEHIPRASLHGPGDWQLGDSRR